MAGRLAALDPDAIARAAAARGVPPEAAGEALKEAGCRVFDDPALRQLLKKIKRATEIRIDTISTDAVVSSGYDEARAQDTTGRFRRFLDEHRDTLIACKSSTADPVQRAGSTVPRSRNCATRCAARPGGNSIDRRYR